MLPSDPMILYSYVNQKLRDDYPSLDALCEDLELDRAALMYAGLTLPRMMGDYPSVQIFLKKTKE